MSVGSSFSVADGWTDLGELNVIICVIWYEVIVRQKTQNSSKIVMKVELARQLLRINDNLI